MRCSNCQEVLSPVVALDIDGTLGNYHEHFIEFAEGWLGMGLPSHEQYDGSLPFWQYLGLDLPLYREVKLAYRQGGLKRTMPAYQYANTMTQRLREEGVEIWIATTRPYLRLDNIDPDTRAWLDRNQIHYDHMIYGDDKYRQLTAIVNPGRIIGVLDDLPEQAVDAHDRGLRPVLRQNYHNRGWMADCSLNIQTVDNLVDAASIFLVRAEHWRTAQQVH